jgi:signal transduction histidine kinase
VVSREKLPVEVNDVVDSSIRLISTQMRSHGLRLECDLADDLPQVLANPFLLEEVILNLVANARDAVEKKRSADPASEVLPIVMRTFTDGDGTERHVVIEVVDHGIGIPESILPNVFDPFFTTKEADEGTGLGLTISKSIVEDTGGSIGARVNAGGGTTVRITLPTTDHEGGGNGDNGD